MEKVIGRMKENKEFAYMMIARMESDVRYQLINEVEITNQYNANDLKKAYEVFSKEEQPTWLEQKRVDGYVTQWELRFNK